MLRNYPQPSPLTNVYVNELPFENLINQPVWKKSIAVLVKEQHENRISAVRKVNEEKLIAQNKIELKRYKRDYEILVKCNDALDKVKMKAARKMKEAIREFAEQDYHVQDEARLSKSIEHMRSINDAADLIKAVEKLRDKTVERRPTYDGINLPQTNRVQNEEYVNSNYREHFTSRRPANYEPRENFRWNRSRVKVEEED